MIMADIYDLEGNKIGEVELPKVFYTRFLPVVIKRAFLAEMSLTRQPYGADPLAGKRSSAHYHGRRKYRFTMMNKEMARISRIHGKGAGYMNYRARVVSQAIKGKKAHPPKAEKKWELKVNRKEEKLAIKSAIAASTKKELVEKRGHKFTMNLPIIVSDDYENIKKTKDVKKALEKLGLKKELTRSEKKKVRAGRGTMRGRKYKKKKGILIITGKDCELLKSAKNIPGLDVAKVQDLKIGLLAPGADAGRLVVFTKSSLAEMEKL